MMMANRIRRVERLLAKLEEDGRRQDARELRQLFREYTDEVRHLEARAGLTLILQSSTAQAARSEQLISSVEPRIDALVGAEDRIAAALEQRNRILMLIGKQVNGLHITVTLVLAFGLVYAFLGFPMPQVYDVVSYPNG